MIFPKGTPVTKVTHWDRSIKAEFRCVRHPQILWRSKDPFSSSWFPVHEVIIDNCDHTLIDGTYVLARDYDNGL